jgi:hypothetical protein
VRLILRGKEDVQKWYYECGAVILIYYQSLLGNVDFIKSEGER